MMLWRGTGSRAGHASLPGYPLDWLFPFPGHYLSICKGTDGAFRNRVLIVSGFMVSSDLWLQPHGRISESVSRVPVQMSLGSGTHQA